MKKRLLSVLSLSLLLTGVAGCNDSGNGVEVSTNSNGETVTTTTITVSFAECGYGSEYLAAWEKAYNDEHPLDKIKLDLDGDSQMTQNIGTRITTETNLPDLVMVLSTNWQVWAAKGYLAEIDDVYQADVQDGKGTKMIDYVDQNLKNFGVVNDSYYAVPWSVGPTGFIYNVSMFEDYGWKIPETTAELEALCEQIKTDSSNTIAPFAWSTATGEYWSFVTLNWWAQYQGVDEFLDFWKFESPEVYKQKGRLEALKEFENLICDHGSAKNSITNAKFMSSQMDFINGKAAMIPNGVWFENEMANNLPKGFKMAMMKTPAITGAKVDANSKVVDVNVNSSGDFIVIPRKAKNVEKAKSFLEFINTQKGCEIFTKEAGGIRPFNYEPSKVEGISEFTKSVSVLWENETNLYQTSNNVMYYNNDLGLWPGYGSPYCRMVQDEDSAEVVENSIYNYVSKNWNLFLNKANKS